MCFIERDGDEIVVDINTATVSIIPLGLRPDVRRNALDCCRAKPFGRHISVTKGKVDNIVLLIDSQGRKHARTSQLVYGFVTGYYQKGSTVKITRKLVMLSLLKWW